MTFTTIKIPGADAIRVLNEYRRPGMWNGLESRRHSPEFRLLVLLVGLSGCGNLFHRVKRENRRAVGGAGVGSRANAQTSSRRTVMTTMPGDQSEASGRRI